ncbi:VanZ family protein [Anaerobacillus arseniciselenatis]|uniref:VanZ family protein n=1 Tax=Anaerobacillus arseniciselenatis TaxID=85682 RepID=A0A1S2LM34_9BACI|nr:VanZ family protein [Anaerobacillus arseniciselenatis]OIJ12747.1 VanZ family protein [Anaerobacillus arseniciselenatis]
MKNNLKDHQQYTRKRKYKKILLFLFFAYLLALIYVTLFAWNYGASLGPVGPGGRNYNLIPFRSIYRIAVYSPTIVDPIKILIGNIVLFIPFGFLAPIAVRFLRKSIIVTTILGMLISVAIETSQFLFTYRVANIDDVILNTFGALIGVILVKICFFINSKIYFFEVKK